MEQIEKTEQPKLDDIITLIGAPIIICINECNRLITNDTIDPMRIVVVHYHLYKTLLKAKRIYSISFPDFRKKDFRAITFQDFYRRIDRSIKEIIISKQPLEVYCVFQYQ